MQIKVEPKHELKVSFWTRRQKWWNTFIILIMQYQLVLGLQGCNWPEIFTTSSSRKHWWTHNGHPLPNIRFQTQNQWRPSFGQAQFDMKATSDGWQQLIFSDDRQSFWIQQLCLDTMYILSNHSFIHSSFTKPMFHGMTATPDNWCKQSSVRPHTYSNTHQLETISAYPVHYRVECISESSSQSAHRYIVRLHVGQQRWVHQCLILRLIAEGNLLWMAQSQKFSFDADQALCDDRNLFDSLLWIPALSAPQLPSPSSCPFSGGFQITSITDLQSRKPFCDYQTFASFESDCVVGEGTEWTFDQTGCNFFEPKQVTRLSCLHIWSIASSNFIILHDSRTDDRHKVYSLVYEDIPENLSPLDKTYKKPQWMWLSAGLLLPAWLAKQTEKSGQTLSHSGSNWLTRLLEHSNELSSLPKVYELQVRRAFGHCDDERLTCDQGCDSDARNRMFCYRTCRSDDNKCDSPQWDSCQFESAYQGDWDLLVPPSEPFASVGSKSLSMKRMRLSIFGKQARILRYSETGNKSALLQCIRQVGETISDWFILRTVDQHNGCRPRDLCLELYQSGFKQSYVDRDTNTMLYRLSRSKQHGTDAMALCRFESPSRQKQNLMSPAKLLVKRTGLQHTVQPIRTVKCGLYQMRLYGTMLINTHQLRWLIHNSTYSTMVSEPPYRPSEADVWKQRKPHFQSTSFQHMQPAEQHIPSQLNNQYPRSSRSPRNTANYLQPNTRKTIHCAIEITDFNRSFGVTGEFDDLLRVQSTCSEEAANFLMNRNHQCISSYKLDHAIPDEASHRMIITYSSSLRDYLCWIFKMDTGSDRKQWVVLVFQSPQCQYTQNVMGNILVTDDGALAKMDLKIGGCLNCHKDNSEQRTVNAEPIISPVPHYPKQLPTVQSTRGRQALRSSQRQPGSSISGIKSKSFDVTDYRLIYVFSVFYALLFF